MLHVPFMDVRRCLTREDYFELVNGPDFTVRWMLENHLALSHQDRQPFTLPGFCTTCSSAVDFAVDFEGAWQAPDGFVVPNWREFMNCPSCGMNARVRMMQSLSTAVLLDGPDKNHFAAYLMEQVTPFYAWACRTFPWASWTGSEFLGPGVSSGTIHEGILHEDAECLSFASASFDLLVSCDVLEHVDQPARALAEIGRVLKPGGTAILSFPMDPHLDANRRRAEVTMTGDVKHLQPPIYHRNPLSPAGSLVFTDFGWEILEQMRISGLTDAAMYVYWSFELGYLGIQYYFLGHRRHS
ncbi:MAG: class I SAM-dependent methyltransferase [Myxococcales bacterium]|nr:class I SAM-dependent methyltransferase [Myxococcales bacterium]